MATQPNLIADLLEQINRGGAANALTRIDELLPGQPGHAGLLTLKAEALRVLGLNTQAIDHYRRAATAGGGLRNWLAAGLLLAGQQRTNEAVDCFNSVLATDPDHAETLNALVTTLFNANRYQEGLPHAQRLLKVSHHAPYLSNAALLLQSNQQFEEATAVFRQILASGNSSPEILGAALVPARYTCDWEWIDSLLERIGAHHARGEFAATREYPLTHLTWCSDEYYNLEVTRAYSTRMLPEVMPLVTRPRRPRPRERIRIGYLSCDFCNHATMHLMAGLLESHDRSRFEVYAYDHSRLDVSEYRLRFLHAVEHHVDISALTDADAAARIAADGLDILIDLKGHTGWGRLGILAHRPAPLQAAWLGYPGTTGTSFIDYIVSDRVVTPDSSTPFYTEQFCRLPHSYQCNDRKRPIAADPGPRTAHGLPEGAVVFSAFNQSYKIDRGSFAVWMRVLREVPDAVLWLLGQGEAAERNLRHYARLAGVSPARLVFAAFAPPERHRARLQLADASLDTLACNGHTTTSDTLWAGVPVITAKGSHFCSRVSESLLRAIELPELVGEDADDMVSIAARIGLDAGYRRDLRERLAVKRLSTPLFDTERFTRNFEAAIERMVAVSRSGQTPSPIDIPDQRSPASTPALHATLKPDAICLERHGGPGDVLMALCAARAIRMLTDRPVCFVTALALRQLAEACPHVDQVVVDIKAASGRYGSLRHINLDPVAYGLSPLHQVDAYLQALGLSAGPELKALDLKVPQEEQRKANRLIASWPARPRSRARILLNVGRNDPNRHWPREHWNALATVLIGLGHQVIALGGPADEAPIVGGMLNTGEVQGLFGSLALMRRADLLVSTDDDAIQLAGASDIAIVGLYSVASADCRLPFRHGEAQWRAQSVVPRCSFFPCYQQMRDPAVMTPFATRLLDQSLSPAELFAQWCPDHGSYACMKQQITPAMVLEAIARLEPRWAVGNSRRSASSAEGSRRLPATKPSSTRRKKPQDESGGR